MVLRRHPCLLMGLLCCLAASLRAELAPPLLHPFSVADVVFEETAQVREYRFILSPVSSIGNKLQAAREWLLHGQLNRVTYEIPRLHGVRDVMEHYVTELKKSQGDILFRCAARDCGSSNDWANQVFRRSTLYGPDREQLYMAGIMPAAGGGQMALVVYVIRRGNQRLYAHLEWITVPAEQTAMLVQQSKSVTFSADLIGRQRALEEAVMAWMEPLQTNPAGYRIYVVSWYRDVQKDTEQNFTAARRQADTLQAWLQGRKIPADQIRQIIVGPLGEDSAYAAAKGSLRLYRETLEPAQP
jgi:hypothetical protein